MKELIGSVLGKKKYPHHMPKIINTTSDWGFIQPLICKEMSAQDTINFKTGIEVQLSPLSTPTFGQVTVRTYSQFVPIESIFHPWGSMMDAKPYRGANATYIPTKVPTISCGLLGSIAKMLSNITIYELADAGTNSFKVAYRSRDLVTASDTQTLDAVYQAFLDNIDLDFCGGDGNQSEWASHGYIPTIDQEDHEIKYYDWFHFTTAVQNRTYLLCGKYTVAGKNFRKICKGLGYKFNNSSRPKSILKLWAYYKAWYEEFAPQRYNTWKNTNCAALQEWCEQNGLFELDDWSIGLPTCYFDFFKDLCKCYGTFNPDYVSAHITGVSNETGPTEQIHYLDADGNDGNVTRDGNNGQAYINVNRLAGADITQSALNVLKALSERTNIRSAIGGRIAQYLKTQFGADYLEEDEHYKIGTDKLDIVAEKVMNQAETENGYLGEFAGKGEGNAWGNEYSFTTKTVGYFIIFMRISATQNYCQGVDRDLGHIKKEDFLDTKFDSKSLVPNEKEYIYGEQELYIEGKASGMGDSFGNIPLYAEYAEQMDLINGDMDLPSSRASLIPYTLQKLLPYTLAQEAVTGSIANLDTNIVVNGTVWRWDNLYRWLGQNNRIFINSGKPIQLNDQQDFENAEEEYFWHSPGNNDNFIVHGIIDYTLHSYKLPMQESFDTAPYDNGIAVEKA